MAKGCSNWEELQVPSPKRLKEDDNQQTSSKKFTGAAVYKSSFRPCWQKKWSYITPVKNDPHSFHCTVCFNVLSCGHQGERDVTQHIASVQHQHNSKAVKNTPSIQSFTAASSRKEKVKLSRVYSHNVYFNIFTDY